VSETEKRVVVAGELDAAAAAMLARRFAEHAGLAEADQWLFSTAVSELARNILKYAGRGEIQLRQLENAKGCYVEICAVDRGPGIADTARALDDHYSTGGTLGLGLPGVRRIMDEFELDSQPGAGTRVVCRKWC